VVPAEPSHGGRSIGRGTALAALLLVGAAVVPLLSTSAPAVPEPVEHVVIVGATGLQWDDVDRTSTPTLWRLTDEGAVGTMSTRAAISTTCQDDGWLTLGAGNRVRGRQRPKAGICSSGGALSPVERHPDGSAVLPDQRAVTKLNDQFYNFGARPGLLAEQMTCTAAFGPGAAIGAARPSGKIDRYAPSLPGTDDQRRELLGECPLALVDVGSVPTADPGGGNDEERRNAVVEVDSAIAAVADSLPDRTLLIVVGVGETDSAPPRMHPAIVYGRGWTGRLTSASTNRSDMVQLVDVAPTALAAMDRDLPSAVLGRPFRPQGSAADPGEVAADLADVDLASQVHRSMLRWFYGLMVAALLAFMVGATVLARWLRQGRTGPAKPFPRALEVTGYALAAVIPSTFLVDLVPWWRLPLAPLWFTVLLAACTAGLTVGTLRGPWRGSPIGPAAALGGFTAGVLAVDVLTGSHMHLNSVIGYSPLIAGRFSGLGNTSFAAFAVGALLLAGCLAHALPAARRGLVVGAIGVLSVLVVGNPDWGNDVGGTVALAPAFALAALNAAGVRLSPFRVAGAFAVGLVAVGGFAAVDLARPENDRTHLGRFVTQLAEGSAGDVVQRKAEANIGLLVSSPLTLLVFGALVFVPVVLLRPGGLLRRVYGLYPSVRAASIGILVAAIIGFGVNDSGIAVPALMVAVAVPLAVAAALAAGRRAVRGTLSPASDGQPEVPREPPPTEPAPDDTAPDDTAPDDTAPDDTAPDDSAPDDSAPDDPAPDDPAPDAPRRPQETHP
jgi:hypothetical protein